MELFSIRIRRTFQLVSTAGMYNSGAIEVVEVPFNGKKVKVEFKRTEAGIFPVGWYEGKIRK